MYKMNSPISDLLLSSPQRNETNHCCRSTDDNGFDREQATDPSLQEREELPSSMHDSSTPELRADIARLTKLRRDLHQIPELDIDLPKTTAYVSKILSGLGDACKVFSPCASTVCAFFDCGSTHSTAIRADMDALPVTEQTGACYASQHVGRMHACGHDGHMAMVLALAEWLAAHNGDLARSVLLVFQPAEETTGGAKTVCESGVFEQLHVDRIFGFHLWPDLKKGVIAGKPGALLASSNEVDVSFHGKGAHIARWQEGRDALSAACSFVRKTYTNIDALTTHEPLLLKFGTMSAGTVRNAIAASSEIHGSLRTFDEADRQLACSTIKAAAHAVSHATGCDSDVHFSDGYPAVINDEPLFDVTSSALHGVQMLSEPLLIAEDFAWYQRYLPGVFLLLGTGTGIPLHADTFDFDEAILAQGLSAYKTLVRLP